MLEWQWDLDVAAAVQILNEDWGECIEYTAEEVPELRPEKLRL